MSTLVIVESPAKCKKIEEYLGSGFKVIASFGHIRCLPDIESIEIENGSFIPHFSLIQDDKKLKHIEYMRSEISKASTVILACDDDREGESICWHICDLFNLPLNKTKRIIFHEITKSAIQSAILSPKLINMNIVYAQQSRQILDLLVGFTISPILWNCLSKQHQGSLSAGRCQTPALRLVYENYLDIQRSPGKLIYNTTSYFTNMNILFELNKQFENENDVRDFLQKSKHKLFDYELTQPKKVLKKSPEPLTTSNLQQLANNVLHISPKETMKYAQELYENGYITYMRTDSKKYSKEFIQTAKDYISTIYGEQFVSSNIDKIGINDEEKIVSIESVADKKCIQEAHEAIRPVKITIGSISDSELSPKAIKLYKLIWERTLESCMPSAQYNSITAKMIYDKNQNLYFNYKSEQMIFAGWQIVKKEFEDDKKVYNYLQILKSNTQFKAKNIFSKFSLIELKSHFTESHLVKLLEEKGIGRPSTFASLIDKIQERKYVEKKNIEGKIIKNTDFEMEDDGKITETISERVFGNENNKLVITQLGIIVIEFLLEKCGSFFEYSYTKQMEDNLDQIASGSLIWSNLCSRCYTILNETTKSIQLEKFNIKIDECHSLIIGKYGPVIKCIDKNKTISFLPVKKDLDINKLKQLGNNIELEDVLDRLDTSKPIGKYKGEDLFIKNGKYGIYVQWGTNKKSIKEQFDKVSIEKIAYLDVLKFLEKDNLLDPTKPVGLVRELADNLSIRTGKYGDYIYYKKPRSKKPDFFKLVGFKSDYKTCDKELLINWIKLTYKI
jgi:DNA topoisomerase-1